MMAAPLATRICILHTGHPSDEVGKPFDKKSWENILAGKQSRLSEQSKYSAV